MLELTYLQTAQTGGVPIIKQGYASKKGGLRNHAYKKRWFVLTMDGRLLYFENNDSTAPLGLVSLTNATLDRHKTENNKLIIKTKSRDWGLKYESAAVCAQWGEALQEVIDLLFSKQRPSAMSMLHLDEDKSLKLFADSDAARAIREVTLTCFTWNLGSRLPDIRELKFLHSFNGTNILAFGLQEFQASASNIITNQHEKNQLPPLEIWNAMLQSSLGPAYSMVATKSMGCMALTCFAHADVVDFVSVLSTGSVPCGIGNVLYNKGAVAISLSVKGTKFSFVSAHLPAHHSKVHDRNMAYRRIQELLPSVLAVDWHDAYCEDSFFDRTKSSVASLAANQSPLAQGYQKLSKRFLGQKLTNEGVSKESWNIFDQVNFERDAEDFDDDVGQVEIDTFDTLEEGGDTCSGSGAAVKEGSATSASFCITKQDKAVIGATLSDGDMKRPDSLEFGVQNKQDSALSTMLDTSKHVIHDRYFFFGDLNYRLDAGKVWVESMVEMAKIFADRERQASAVGGMSGSPATGVTYFNSQRDDNTEIVDEELSEIDKSTKNGLIQEDTIEGRYSNSPTIEVMDLSEIERLRSAGMAKWRLNSIINESWDTGLATDASFYEVAGSAEPHVKIAGPRDWKGWQVQNEATQAERGPMDLKSRIQFFKDQTGLTSSDSIFTHLLLFDQLLNEKEQGHVCQGYKEGHIRFPPTYKFDSYSRKYDTGKKARRPAWCDRVLYSSTHPNTKNYIDSTVTSGRYGEGRVRKRTVTGLTIIENVDSPQALAASAAATNLENTTELACDACSASEGIQLLDYDCVDGLFYSDHRPVFAKFRVDLVDCELSGSVQLMK